MAGHTPGPELSAPERWSYIASCAPGARPQMARGIPKGSVSFQGLGTFSQRITTSFRLHMAPLASSCGAWGGAWPSGGGLAHTLLLLQGIFNGEKVPSLAPRGTHQRVQILQTLALAVGDPFTRERYRRAFTHSRQGWRALLLAAKQPHVSLGTFAYLPKGTQK